MQTLDLAKKIYGWQPEYSGNEGFRRIKNTVDWFSTRKI